jgi:hypothetical protein
MDKAPQQDGKDGKGSITDWVRGNCALGLDDCKELVDIGKMRT